MNSKTLGSRLTKLQLRLATAKGAKGKAQAQYDELQNKINFNVNDSKIKKDAYLFLLGFIAQRRDAAIQSIQDTGTYALRAIYNDDRRLLFMTNGEKKSAAAFKMEIGIESTLNGNPVVTGLKDERGGGVCETSSFALRIAALEWLGYKGPLILDEAYKSMSSDEKLDLVAQFMRKYVDTSKRQVLFATHNLAVFGDYADHIIHVSQEDGISKVN